MAVLFDATEQERLEHLRNEFFAMVLHDLVTPITSIKLGTYMLQEHEPLLARKESSRTLRMIASETDIGHRRRSDRVARFGRKWCMVPDSSFAVMP